MKVKKDYFIKVYREKNGDYKEIKQILEKEYGKLGRNYVNQTVRKLRSTGDIPLESGNKVSTGEILKGTSTLYDADGNVKIQWVKTNVEKEDMLKQFEEAVENIISSNVEPIEPTEFSGYIDEDILVKIPIADAHIGLLTWHKEVGQDFDLKIAEKIYTEAIYRLIAASPSAGTCLLLDLGGYRRLV